MNSSGFAARPQGAGACNAQAAQVGWAPMEMQVEEVEVEEVEAGVEEERKIDRSMSQPHPHRA